MSVELGRWLRDRHLVSVGPSAFEHKSPLRAGQVGGEDASLAVNVSVLVN